MGGSAFDLQGGVSGVLPKNQPLLSTVFSYRRYAALYQGTSEVEGNTNVLERFTASFGVQHYFGGGLSANVTLPTGYLS